MSKDHLSISAVHVAAQADTVINIQRAPENRRPGSLECTVAVQLRAA
jgi:hypothetical protein